MAEALKLASGNLVAVINSPRWSKINWTAALGGIIATVTALGIVIPKEWEETVYKTIALVSPFVTFILRTWFTASVPTTGELKAATSIKTAG